MEKTQSPWSVRTTAEAASIIRASSASPLILFNHAKDNRSPLSDAGLSLPDPLATLITVPIPEQWEPAGQVIQQAVEQAVADLEQSGVRGKEATFVFTQPCCFYFLRRRAEHEGRGFLFSSPWLLSRVSQLTQGSAVQSSSFTCRLPPRKSSFIHVLLSFHKIRYCLDRKQCSKGSRDRRPRG